MNYTDEELDILKSIESGEIKKATFDNNKIKSEAKKTLNSLNQKKQISINLKQKDLEFLKNRAKQIGISYQNIIQALVHNYTSGELELKI